MVVHMCKYTVGYIYICVRNQKGESMDRRSVLLSLSHFCSPRMYFAI